MKLSPQQQAIFDRLSGPSDDDFTGLIELAGLDPARDFRGADLSGVRFGKADLRKFDFRDADLSGADLSRAVVSDKTLAGSNLTRAKLPGERVLSYPQQDLLTAILDHFQHVRRRVLAIVPPGAGVHAIAIELASCLADEATYGWGLFVCSTRAEVEQCLRRMEQQLGHFALPLSDFVEGARAAPWYVATYNDAISMLRGDSPDIGRPLESLNNVIFTGLDRASPKAATYVLERTKGAGQACFMARSATALLPSLGEYFAFNDIHEYVDPRYTEENLRPFVLEDRRPLRGPRFPWQGKKLDLRMAMDDLAMTLASEKRLGSKTVVLCSSEGQLIEAMHYFEELLPRHIGEFPRHFDPQPARPRTRGEFQHFLRETEYPPFFIFCLPNVVADVFETPPDVVAVLMNRASGRTVQLWELARKSRDSYRSPIVVADYTGAVVSTAGKPGGPDPMNQMPEAMIDRARIHRR